MISREDDTIGDREMDLLVDGELDDASRRDLLARLDASPDGWRRCALAFLESQALSEAISPEARDVPPAPIVLVKPPARRVVPWIARAAMVLLAFGLGWAVHGEGREPTPSRVVVMPSPIARPIPSPARPAPALSALPRDRPEPLDYVRGRLEREGYRVEPKLLLVPAATKDGRRFAVPVEGMSVLFVGNRSV